MWFGPNALAVVAVAALPMILRRPPPAGGEAHRPLDAVSGLPLREAAVASLDQTLTIPGRSSACLVLALDGAQDIVDRHGQAAHDRILRQIAERLQSALRERDCIARLEGDRFAVALAPVWRADLESVIQIAARLQDTTREPFSIDAMTLYVTVSVGFCLMSRAGARTGEALLSAAETALEDARRNGPGAIRAFSPEIAAAACARDSLRDRLELALENGEIVAWFQPQLSTDTGEVSGFEALARWIHPERGVLAPGEFLTAVQQAGLAPRLGETMLFHALTALRSWDRAGIRVPNVAVNFSKEELRNPRLADRVAWELDRFDMTADRLTAEILESVVSETENDTITRNIAALAELGCNIDLDDFGTGHASITSIRRFAINRIKIDRSFVARVDSDPGQQKMIAAILSMADRLGLATLAEGVETVSEHSMLSQLGCGHVQGYSIARPMPFPETIAWLERHRSRQVTLPSLTRRLG